MARDDADSPTEEHSATFYHERLKDLKQKLNIDDTLPASRPFSPMENNPEPEVTLFVPNLFHMSRFRSLVYASLCVNFSR